MTQPLAIVFGGSRGIGAACVDALAHDGARSRCGETSL